MTLAKDVQRQITISEVIRPPLNVDSAYFLHRILPHELKCALWYVIVVSAEYIEESALRLWFNYFVNSKLYQRGRIFLFFCEKSGLST
jgi:hypothetical protein